jgi:hypothetical protein
MPSIVLISFLYAGTRDRCAVPLVSKYVPGVEMFLYDLSHPLQERMKRTLEDAGFTVAGLSDSLGARSKESEVFRVFLSGV